jgi:hypothetical protein
MHTLSFTLQSFIGLALGHTVAVDTGVADGVAVESGVLEKAEPGVIEAADVEAPTLEFSLAEAELAPDDEAESEELGVALPEDVSCAEYVPFSDGVGVALEPSLNEVDTTPDTDSELVELALSLSDPVVVSQAGLRNFESLCVGSTVFPKHDEYADSSMSAVADIINDKAHCC